MIPPQGIRAVSLTSEGKAEYCSGWGCENPPPELGFRSSGLDFAELDRIQKAEEACLESLSRTVQGHLYHKKRFTRETGRC
jgi:hypothetical protein